jgi:hypothetical protein
MFNSVSVFRSDCDGKFCVNGGILDLQTCACNCIKEVKAYKNHEHCECKLLIPCYHVYILSE